MADLIQVPLNRVPEASLHALLEEYASRDGTDYGAQEVSLERKVGQLLSGLERGRYILVFDGDSEMLDVLSVEAARDLPIVYASSSIDDVSSADAGEGSRADEERAQNHKPSEPLRRSS